MKKIAIFFVLFLFFPKFIFASDKFLVSSDITYKLLGTEGAIVNHEITITNATTEFQANYYILSLSRVNISKIKAYSEGKELEVEISPGDVTNIKIHFDKPVAGAGKSKKFSLEYLDSSVVKQAGDLFEILVPKLNIDDSNSHLIKLIVPKSFGELAYISPFPDNSIEKEDFRTYYFKGELLTTSGITAAFGKFQVFSFDLTYRLQNPLAFPAKLKIALPPDTSYQRVFYESINPKPKHIFIDNDGNWIAEYNLSARERVDVRALGSVQVFAFPWKLEAYSGTNLSSTKYWQTDDPEIKSLAQKLKTPKEIYDYVVSTLNYNYQRVRSGVQRKGAIEALKNPNDAICTEFTDLFIAIARAAGIPAREINGFAYTDNTSLMPLSLVADVLHAWPEYWDNEKGVWVPVDPTWGKTTGGVDYFSKFDMRRVTFVIHNKDPENPTPPGSYKLGANPQKDVFINLGSLPEILQNAPIVSIKQKTSLPFQGLKIVAEIENIGPSALYNQNLELFFDGKKEYENMISTILPYEKKTLEFTMPYGFLGRSMPSRAKVVVGEGFGEFKTNRNPGQIRDISSLLLAIFLFSFGGYLIFKKRAIY